MQAVSWLRSHDAEARRIAGAGRAFALRHLVRPARMCYWSQVLTRLGKLFRYVCIPTNQ